MEGQLISYLVVADDYKATIFACQSMLQEGEIGITTVTGDGEIGRHDAILHGYGISELLSQEFSPIDGGGKSGQPCSPCAVLS